MNQSEMSAHDKKTWELYSECVYAGQRLASALGFLDAVTKRSPSQISQAESELAKARRDEQKAEAALDEHEKNYTGWARFWCVPQGHIHRSRHCSTCNKNGNATSFYLAHEVSGMDEEAAVKAQGPVLCTVCFPSAPVDWTNGIEVEAAKRKASKCQADPYNFKDASDPRLVYRYATCNVCGGRISLTTTGKMRSHKPGA